MQRTETSHVTAEKKSIEIPWVVARKQGRAQTLIYQGVVGLNIWIFQEAEWLLERTTIAGKSP